MKYRPFSTQEKPTKNSKDRREISTVFAINIGVLNISLIPTAHTSF